MEHCFLGVWSFGLQILQLRFLDCSYLLTNLKSYFWGRELVKGFHV
jgi:hypothetical protein